MSNIDLSSVPQSGAKPTVQSSPSCPVVDLCRDIEKAVVPHGLHVALGGGVLTKDGPRKDVDIFLYRHSLGTARPAPHLVLQSLESLGLFVWKYERTSSGNDKEVYVGSSPKCGDIRVDLFSL